MTGSRVVAAATIVQNGMISDAANAAQLVAAAQGAGAHVGTPNADLTLPFNGQTLSFYLGVPFIADAALYAWINSTNLASNITWAD